MRIILCGGGNPDYCSSAQRGGPPQTGGGREGPGPGGGPTAAQDEQGHKSVHWGEVMPVSAAAGLPLSALAVLLSVTTLAATESNIREDPESLALWTDDGLWLTLSRADGRLVGLTSDSGELLRGPAPLLRLEEVLIDPEAPDLLADGSFEAGLGAWVSPGGAVEAGPEGIGGHWLRLSGPDPPTAERTLELRQARAQPLVVTGLCRAQMRSTASGWMNVHLAINTYGTYANGEAMPEQSAYFGQYDHGPQLGRKVLCPDHPLDHLKLLLTVPGPECTAWYSGIAVQNAEYRITSPTTPCERISHRVLQEFEDAEAGLDGVLAYRPRKEAIEIECRLRSDQRTDRAVSATIALPVDFVGGKWHDDARTWRRIEPRKMYRNAKWYGAGRDGWDSRYPIACIEDASGTTLGIGTAVDEPRVFQTEYDAAARELRIRFDLGLSPDAGRWANRSEFTVYLFRYDGRDGFRGATDKYHRLFDWAFMDKRAQHEGLWSAFVTPAAIAGGWEDFGFQFVEAVGNAGWESRQGLTSLKYAEPWICHHESPPHAPFEEARGPVDPQAAIQRARDMAARRDAETPPDSRYRYADYLGSYVPDAWGQPQGYFFRDPAGRNENMMIVNPNPALPSPEQGHWASGDLDWDNSLQALGVWKQWSLEGWTLYRVGERPCLEADAEGPSSGSRCIRLDPVRSEGYWEQYVRGLSQVIYNPEHRSGPFEFSFSARATNVPQSGTGLSWSIELQTADDRVTNHVIPLAGLSSEWKTFRQMIPAQEAPFAIRALLVNLPWFPDPTTLWIDDVRLVAAGDGRNLLANGDFEAAELIEGEVDGIYLDTMECYTNNLNYSREHWPYADEPPTFDCSRRPALQQQFSHVTYTRVMADWLRRRELLLFGNCAPGTCFGAPYLDILGGEENWLPGGQWQPKSDADFSFVRFMCRAKPFCLLQYGDLDAEQMRRYIQRCVFYGVWPGNQSSSATSGKWYWTNPVRVARDRPAYATYIPILKDITRAGWEPVTLAQSSDPDVLIERFGDGETVYLTLLNVREEGRSPTVRLDDRLASRGNWRLYEMVQRRELGWAEPGVGFALTLAPEEVRVVRLSAG